MLSEYLKIVASSTGCLTINDTKKSVTVNIDKTMNNTLRTTTENRRLYFGDILVHTKSLRPCYIIMARYNLQVLFYLLTYLHRCGPRFITCVNTEEHQSIAHCSVGRFITLPLIRMSSVIS